MAKQINIADETEQLVDQFARSMNPVQKRLYTKVSALLKELSIDSEGNIKRTVSNFNIISKVERELKSIVHDPSFQRNVAQINDALSDVNKMQRNFFTATQPDFTQPKVIQAYHDQAFDDAVASLTGAGMTEQVINSAADIVKTGITEGTSFADMNDQLRESMLGTDDVEGKMVSYSKQILSDTLHNQARNYNSLVADDLGLEWYEYIGPLKDTSREWCIALEEKRWIHQSELGSIARGVIDGEKVSLAGLMPDTDADNVVQRCGGYNCQHHMVPVPAERVPSSIRREFEDGVEPDEDEINEDLPSHD